MGDPRFERVTWDPKFKVNDLGIDQSRVQATLDFCTLTLGPTALGFGAINPLNPSSSCQPTKPV